MRVTRCQHQCVRGNVARLDAHHGAVGIVGAHVAEALRLLDPGVPDDGVGCAIVGDLDRAPEPAVVQRDRAGDAAVDAVDLGRDRDGRTFGFAMAAVVLDFELVDERGCLEAGDVGRGVLADVERGVAGLAVLDRCAAGVGLGLGVRLRLAVLEGELAAAAFTGMLEADTAGEKLRLLGEIDVQQLDMEPVFAAIHA